MKLLKLAISIITVMLIAVIFCGCTTSAIGTVFSTSYQIELEGKSSKTIAKNIESDWVKHEELFSVSIPTSDVSRINDAEAHQPVVVSNDTIQLITISKQLYNATNGQFNPAIYPLTQLWGFAPDNFSTEKATIPTQQEITSTLAYCSMDEFSIDEDNNTVTKLHSQARIDFGGIAKGYAVDKARDRCSELSSYLINIGGEITVGKQEKTIAIASPFDDMQYADTITLSNQAVATSGVYERFFTYQNKKYHHILANDGYPAKTNLLSVTVISDSAMTCDALATCGLLLPKQSFAELLSSYSATAILIDSDGNISRL